MKKINSIWYGGKVILLGIILSFGLPIIIRIIPFKLGFLGVISRISFLFGIVILISFSILLIIELHQDKKIDQCYDNQKGRKLKIKDNKYECQACGNRAVKKYDMNCNVCGVHFHG